MRLYRYRAVDRQGMVRSGEEVARNPGALRTMLLGDGLEPLSWRSGGTLRGAMQPAEQIEFAFSLEQLLRAGMPLLEAVSELASGHHPLRLRALACQLRRSIEGGEPLSAALRKATTGFDPLALALIRVGEESGQLGGMLAALHHELRRREMARAALRRALTQPVLTLTAIVAIGGYMVVVVVPSLAGLATALGQTPPLETRLLLLLGGAISESLPWLLTLLPPALIIGSLLVKRVAAISRLRDRIVLTLWWFGPLIRRAELIRFCRSSALLYRSGVPLLDSLPLAAGTVSNRIVAEALAEAHRELNNGAALSDSLARSGQLPPLMIRMVAMGERGGVLDEALENVATLEEEALNRSLQRMQAMLEPLLTLILGAALAWVMIAVLGPVFEVIAGVSP
jgi:type IV pilus assembly protein PilC